MFQRLKTLYGAGRINEAMLDVAVSKGWITLEEKDTIIAA